MTRELPVIPCGIVPALEVQGADGTRDVIPPSVVPAPGGLLEGAAVPLVLFADPAFRDACRRRVGTLPRACDAALTRSRTLDLFDAIAAELEARAAGHLPTSPCG